MKFYARLLHNGIGSKAGFDFGIHRKISVGLWAEPNAMVAFAAPHKNAIILA
jgi:hypothetical protein